MNFLVCSTSIFGDNIDIREVSGTYIQQSISDHCTCPHGKPQSCPVLYHFRESLTRVPQFSVNNVGGFNKIIYSPGYFPGPQSQKLPIHEPLRQSSLVGLLSIFQTLVLKFFENLVEKSKKYIPYGTRIFQLCLQV